MGDGVLTLLSPAKHTMAVILVVVVGGSIAGGVVWVAGGRTQCSEEDMNAMGGNQNKSLIAREKIDSVEGLTSVQREQLLRLSLEEHDDGGMVGVREFLEGLLALPDERFEQIVEECLGCGISSDLPGRSIDVSGLLDRLKSIADGKKSREAKE